MTRFPHTLLALATALPLVVALFAVPLLTGQEPDIYQQVLTLLTSVLLGGWVMHTFRKEAQ